MFAINNAANSLAVHDCVPKRNFLSLSECFKFFNSNVRNWQAFFVENFCLVLDQFLILENFLAVMSELSTPQTAQHTFA